MQKKQTSKTRRNRLHAAVPLLIMRYDPFDTTARDAMMKLVNECTLNAEFIIIPKTIELEVINPPCRCKKARILQYTEVPSHLALE